MSIDCNTSRRAGGRLRERGAVMLLAVAFLVLVLGGLAAAFMSEGLAERTSVVHHETSMQALEVVEMGLARGEMEVLGLSDLDGDGIGTVSGDFAGGEYEVAGVQNPTLPNRFTLTGRGVRRLSVRRVEVGLRRWKEGTFSMGLFAKKDFTFGATIDSYNSDNGSWASQPKSNDGFGDYVNTNGSIGSNGTITVMGSSTAIRGDAIPGPGQDTITINGDPLIQGDTFPRTDLVSMDDPPLADFEAALATNDNGTLDASVYNAAQYKLSTNKSGAVNIGPGTFFFSEIDLGAQAYLNVTGPVTIYVTGDVDLSGQPLVNASGVASDLIIVAHPYELTGVPTPPALKPPYKGNLLKFVGGSDACFAAYAPSCSVTISGNADISGAVVANDITVTGTPSIHYDEALEDWNGGGRDRVERLWWYEPDPPRR